MKKIVFIFLLFFVSTPVFAAVVAANCPSGSLALKGYSCPGEAFFYNGGTCSGRIGSTYTSPRTVMDKTCTNHYCHEWSESQCSCPSGSTLVSFSDPSTGSGKRCETNPSSSSSSSSAPPEHCSASDTCVCGVNEVKDLLTKKCVSNSSSSSSPSDTCPSGQFKDSLGSCNTKCDASAGVFNPVANACQQPADCVYPQKRNPITNSCSSNEDKCAINASMNIISGYTCQQCAGCPAPSCPSGWTITQTNQCVQNQTSSAPSSSGSGSSSPSNTSSPSSSGSTSSTPPKPKPPTDPSDNTDPSQSTSGSQYIPPGQSNSQCLLTSPASSCTAMQNCQLTFGVDNCVGMTSGQNCPNSYTINGQKICVLNTSGSNSSSGSGSGTSSGSNTSEAGECDPTAKSYDECMGRDETPTQAQTQQILDDFDNAGNAALDDYLEAYKADLDDIKNNSISFKDAPSQLKQVLISMIPQPRSCQNIPFIFYGKTINLNCVWFEKFKQIFGWFLYIITAIYIFKLAMRPVPS